ncbi:MAG: carbohydrate binding domain-containing protein, partial [Candidatus Hydrogenedentes bacterium]|nr:carbohydrate binding domain-containing protein [Candidatus Hydrogenedentota bacterium]
WTNVESAWLQLSGGVGATVWVDHITLTDTSAEGMLGDPPPAPTLLVVADFEGGINTDAVIGNWGWRTDVTNDTDVPDGGGTGSMKGVATDTGGMGLRFNSDPTFAGAADFSGYSYINFYMKVDETGNDFSFSLRCCQEDNDPRRSNAALASLFEPPAAGTWGYISIALADIDLGPAGGATEALQWTNVESAWLQLSGGVGATVWVDHITLTDTSARGMLAAPPEPPAEGMPVSTNWALIFTVAAVMFSAVLFFGRKSLRS